MAIVGRQAECATVNEFLDAAVAEPVALVIEGERGIGKTTVWWEGVEQARARGWQVLTTRPVHAESVLAYGGLADLLATVDPHEFAALPAPQRVAIDRVLLRGDASSEPTDPRAVAAAFLAVVDRLAETAPTVIAVDDLQWLDRSSAAAIAFAARRLSGAASVLATLRTEADTVGSWLQLPRPESIRRITIGPLSLGALHAIVTDRVKSSFTRPAMVRIHELSSGNPFYAIELARTMADNAGADDIAFPPSLSELVRSRLDGLGPAVHDLLLAAACAAAPTVDLVARATGTHRSRVVELFADVEARGIIGYEGLRLRFGHPIVAAGILAGASPSERRAMHRRLAGVVAEPELRARHLALAAVTGDETTLRALDVAARSASVRGAPAAAAELLDLAIGLGGDTVERRVELARHCFYAGDAGRARELLERAIGRLEAGTARAGALALLGVVRLFDESFVEAAGVLEPALSEAGEDAGLRVQMLISLAFALVNAGDLDAAIGYSDTAVTEALTLAETPDADDAVSRALSMRAVLGFMRGDGLDEHVLRRALELEDRSAATPVAFRPTAHSALLHAWTGELHTAADTLAEVRRQCLERGEESELIFVSYHAVFTDLWRGDIATAGLICEDFVVHAAQLGGDLPRSVALASRAVVTAYLGQTEGARRDATEAMAIAQRCSSARLGEWPRMALGFVAVSQGDYDGAIATLEPLWGELAANPANTEIITAWFVPDAVEALIAVGRLDDAEMLIAPLERNGRRLDRAWMLACAARGRALWLAARGDLDAAADTVHRAMTEHQRLPMPFERARTQLLAGQIERRQRRNHVAATNLRQALDVFERLGTPLWADRTRAELGRANVGPHSASTLTPSEQRVAELAASGMTNRDVAAALFISPKTVEANLARIYRKLGIRSRAELGRHMARPPTL